MIQINELYKSFGKNKVLKGVNLSFDKPGISAVLGPNGSGKTTLIKSILGMVLPDKGTIKIGEEDIKGKWKYRNKIDYLPQIARFPENLKVKELMRMVKDLRSQKANDKKLIDLFDLHPFMDKRLSNLSGGTRQKVNLVLAFMYDSPLIILDEPTVGLDPIALLRLKDLINFEKGKGKTILITTHIMSFVEEIADDIVFLLEGHIHFKGSLEKIKSQYKGNTLEEAIANILLKQNGKVIRESDYQELVPLETPSQIQKN